MKHTQTDTQTCLNHKVQLSERGPIIQRPKTAEIDVFRAKKWLYVIGTLFLSHFDKKNFGQFLAKATKIGQKWPKMEKKMAKTVKNSKKCPNTAKIIYLRVKKWSYVIDHFFWHILAKFKKNPRNGFFTKSQKPQNDVNFGTFGPPGP